MKVLITGPILGYNKNREKSQAEYLIDIFKSTGIDVAWASRYPLRIKRGIDIVKTILKNKDANLGIILVFSYAAFAYVDLASFIMKSAGIPIVFWLHGGALPEFTQKYKKWVKRVLKRGTILISPTEYLSNYYEKLGFRIKIIRNTIKVKQYPFSEDNTLKPRFLWMRTFHPLYNPDMALYAFKEILKHIPEATLTMAGVDRGIEKDVKKLAEKLGIYERVSFPGFLDTEKKIKHLSENYIYLHTNNVDNTPVSVIEALASGLIVIATRAGGIPYLLSHGKNALLVEKGDYKNMALYALKLLNKEIDFKPLKREGRRLAEEFDKERVKKDWLELIKQIA